MINHIQNVKLLKKYFIWKEELKRKLNKGADL